MLELFLYKTFLKIRCLYSAPNANAVSPTVTSMAVKSLVNVWLTERGLLLFCH